jgi:hypothetical protein
MMKEEETKKESPQSFELFERHEGVQWWLPKKKGEANQQAVQSKAERGLFWFSFFFFIFFKTPQEPHRRQWTKTFIPFFNTFDKTMENSNSVLQFGCSCQILPVFFCAYGRIAAECWLLFCRGLKENTFPLAGNLEQLPLER